jgi:molecular chaperone DnaK
MESFGIDFGTTNSAAVGWSSAGMGRTFGERSGRPLPSVVAIHKITGEVYSIGSAARENRELLGAECEVISSVKSFLAQSDKSWSIGPRVWKTEDIAAEIIKELRKSIQSRLAPGERLMDRAVFSIPVGCSMAQRRTLRRAAQLAGIEVSSFISEPTAALCRHFNDAEVRQWSKVAVFDWGGGTLDISIVQISGDVVTEIATYGRRLGGDDLDRKLAEYLHGQIMTQRGTAMPFTAVPPEHRDLLTQRAELAKIELGSADEFPVRLLDYCGSPAHVQLSVDTMIRLFEPFMNDAFEAFKHTVQTQARCSFEEIGCLLMVGGTSKIRGLYDFFRDRGWPNHMKHPPDGDWNIAQGAAINALNPGSYVAGQDFGLVVSDGSYFPLIIDGQTIHLNEGAQQYFGLVEDSSEARLVFAQPQGSNGYANGAPLETIGYLTIPAYGFSNEPIALKTWVDENLVVNVRGHSPRQESQQRNWYFEKLKFRYKLASRP